MSHTTNRTFICSVVFLDIVAYSQQPVNEQITLKNRFNTILAEAIKDVAVNDRIILDTGDGAAISFLGDPEDALFVALSIRDAILGDACTTLPCLYARIGINLGPVKLVQDINGQRNLIGDGINDAQRVMSFANPGQVLVSRSYFEVISRLSQEYAKLFHYEGSHADKHVREHQVYSVSPADKEKAPSPAPVVHPREEPSKDTTGVGAPAAAPVAQQREAPTKETAGAGASTSTAPVGAEGQSGKIVAAAAGQPFHAPQKDSRLLVWKKLLDGWVLKSRNGIQALISRSANRFSWNELRNNRPMLYGAAALFVILIGVPLILWKAGGAPTKDPGAITPPTSVAMPEAAATAKTPTTAVEEQNKTAAATVETPATLSFGIAPWGEVYVDDNKKGVSPPLNSLQVSPGKHVIEIRNTSFASFKQNVDVKPGEQVKIRHKFR
jgi:class 3 adenylate cyclase